MCYLVIFISTAVEINSLRLKKETKSECAAAHPVPPTLSVIVNKIRTSGREGIIKTPKTLDIIYETLYLLFIFLSFNRIFLRECFCILPTVHQHIIAS